MHGPGKLVVIGLDGATFRVLRPLVDAGVIPTLSRFLRDGASGVLMSTHPPVTCPAWPTMVTGVNPGRHGVFSFSHRDPENGHVRTASEAEVRAPKIWDLIGQAGQRVAVLNVPITFPARRVNGVMLTGFVSPERSPHIAWPPSLNEDLRARFPDLAMNWTVLKRHPRAPKKQAAHIVAINELLRLRIAQFEFILSNCDVDFCFLVHEYTDRVQHLFYHLLDPRCTAHRSPVYRTSVDLLCQGFRELDAAIERLVHRFGEDANYVLISDHGFGAVSRWVYVNNLLEQHGLLATRAFKTLCDLATREARLPARLRSWLGLELRDPWHRQDPFRAPLLDYCRTKALAGPQFDHAVYVNLKGRDPHGIVAPGKEYEGVRQAVIDILTSATDPGTGARVFAGVWRREDIYTGDYVMQAPDLVYELAPDYMTSNATLPRLFLNRRFFRDIGAGWAFSGYHRPEGILVGYGPAFRCVQHLEASILDVAPTLLYLLDLPIPRYMEGRVVEAALRPGLIGARPPAMSDAGPVWDDAADTLYTAQEQGEAIGRLQDLGYL